VRVIVSVARGLRGVTPSGVKGALSAPLQDGLCATGKTIVSVLQTTSCNVENNSPHCVKSQGLYQEKDNQYNYIKYASTASIPVQSDCQEREKKQAEQLNKYD
jgi:hypothetical protein